MSDKLRGEALTDMLEQRVHRWSKKQYKLGLNEDEVFKLIQPLVQAHDPEWLPGSPTIRFGDEEFDLDQFTDIMVNRLLATPGAVEEIKSTFGGNQLQEDTEKNDRYEKAVSSQLIFRLLKSNPGRWFSVMDIGEELDIFDDLIDLDYKSKRDFTRRKKSIRRYVQSMRSLNRLIQTRNIGQCVQYRYFEK